MVYDEQFNNNPSSCSFSPWPIPLYRYPRPRHSQPDFETTSENRYLITIVLHVGHRSLEYLVRDRRTCLYRAAPRSQEPKTLRTSSSSLSSPTDEHEFMKAHAGTVLCLLSFGATLGHATEH